MGDPKRQRKKYESPRFPWRTDVLQSELRLIGEYGLRNKHELWRHRTLVSKLREIARSLLGVPGNERTKSEGELLRKLERLGVLSENAVLDNVLDLSIDDILQRRLQTIVLRKGLARTIYQSRQFITHGHIAIGDRRVFSPSYLVLRDEEGLIGYATASPMSNPDHPLRSSIELGAKEPVAKE